MSSRWLPSDIAATPAGKQLEWFLDQIASGAADLDEAQLLDRLSENIFTRASPTYILQAWRRLASEIVSFEVVIAEAVSPFDIRIEIQAADGWEYGGHCLVDEVEPYRVRTFGLNLKPKPEREISALEGVGELLAHHGVPGMSVALLTNGRLDWARAWGVASVEDSSPVTAETLFQAGSVSKPVSALAALRLVDDGLLHLDEDINERLSSWKLPANSGWQARVTLRNLLSHLGGIAVWGFAGYGRDEDIPTLRQVLEGEPPANSPAIRVEAVPELHWRYSGGGYCVLQQLMIDVTGKSYPELMRDLVLDPLKMTNSTFDQPLPDHLHDLAASGHDRGRVVPGKWHVYPEMAAAALWTTPADLAQFIIGIEAARSQQPGSILTKATVEQMLTPQPGEPSIGLGLVLTERNGVLRIEHGGGNQGFVCNMSWLEDGSVGLVVMTNSSQGGAILKEMARYSSVQTAHPEMAGFNPFVGEVVEAMSRAPTYSEKESPIERSASASGTFEVRPAFSITLKDRRDHLVLELPDQPELLLYPAEPSGWIGRSVPIHVGFSSDGSETPAAITLTQYGRSLVASRIS